MDGQYRIRTMRSQSKPAPTTPIDEKSVEIQNFGQGADNFMIPKNSVQPGVETGSASDQTGLENSHPTPRKNFEGHMTMGKWII